MVFLSCCEHDESVGNSWRRAASDKLFFLSFIILFFILLRHVYHFCCISLFIRLLHCHVLCEFHFVLLMSCPVCESIYCVTLLNFVRLSFNGCYCMQFFRSRLIFRLKMDVRAFVFVHARVVAGCFSLSFVSRRCRRLSFQNLLFR